MEMNIFRILRDDACVLTKMKSYKSVCGESGVRYCTVLTPGAKYLVTS